MAIEQMIKVIWDTFVKSQYFRDMVIQLSEFG